MSVPSLGVEVNTLKLEQARLSNEQKQANEHTVSIVLELPSGTKDVMKFRPDLTIGYVKVEVAKKYGIPFESQEFELNGTVLADPFSLADYPAIKASTSAHPVLIVVRQTSNDDDDDECDDDDVDGDDDKNDEEDNDVEEYDMDDFEQEQ